MKRFTLVGILGTGLLCAAAGDAAAAPSLRVMVDQEGDFALIGNTLGQDCRRSVPKPVVGTVGSCGDEQAVLDSAPDVLWRADSPDLGQAEANAEISSEQARTAAMLVLPDGAVVTHALLYWSAQIEAGVDTTAIFDREDAFHEEVTALDSWEVTINRDKPDEAHMYQSVADVTALVKAHGAGAFRVGGIDVIDIRGLDDTRTYAGWWMVVLYEAPGMPRRNLAVFDGLERVSRTHNQTFSLEGLRIPEGGLEAKLGIVGYEGDYNIGGDRLYINPSSVTPNPKEALGDEMNPADNFFNGSRGWLGMPVSVEGDLPQLTGEPQSMPGVDIDVVDISSRVKGGDTAIRVLATADEIDGDAELYFIGGLVTSIAPGPGGYLSGSGMFGPCAVRGVAGDGWGGGWLFGVALAGLVSWRRTGRRR
ncbi:hypothetical protein [Chondromyces crocatus]|uniref:DUF2330 domain-containing protein n=1 Tax=Chondromyces crocatus TaxID=52 RepID=A0A0K1E7M9_CHOCO|nr:hypothetical protein [Chondromyces crocatus]AKT36558.1 uncharacterized protein CMC5_006760 [Chondromyces crocatus]